MVELNKYHRTMYTVVENAIGFSFAHPADVGLVQMLLNLIQLWSSRLTRDRLEEMLTAIG